MTRLVPVFVEVLLPVCIVVLLGYLARLRLQIEPRPITRLALYILSPCLVFSSLAQSAVSVGDSVQMALLALGSMLVAGLLGLLLAGLRGADRAARNAQILVSMFPNAGNLGLAVVRLAFGDPGVERAVVFFVTSALLTNSLGVYIVASSQGGRRRALRQVVSMPQVYAVTAALLFRATGLAVPTAGAAGGLFAAIDLLADATIPVFLLVLGMQLTDVGGGLRAITAPVGVAVATRLLLAAPVAYGLGRALGMDDLGTRVAMIEASMPAAVYCVILAYEFDSEPKFVTTVVVVSTLASMVTLTVLLSLLL